MGLWVLWLKWIVFSTLFSAIKTESDKRDGIYGCTTWAAIFVLQTVAWLREFLKNIQPWGYQLLSGFLPLVLVPLSSCIFSIRCAFPEIACFQKEMASNLHRFGLHCNHLPSLREHIFFICFQLKNSGYEVPFNPIMYVIDLLVILPLYGIFDYLLIKTSIKSFRIAAQVAFQLPIKSTTIKRHSLLA